MPGDVDEQLAALAEVSGLMAEAGVDHWLFGGWAVEFHAGAVTRRHDNVDLAVWLDDLPRIGAMLEGSGWRHAPQEEDGGTGYERDRVRLELTFLVRDGAGRIFTPLRDGRAEWADDAFGGDVRRLGGAEARVIALGPLRAGKAWPRGDAADMAKDRADLAVLEALGPG
jgi:hypothetical protein